ncbi:MAG: phosphate acyltransferase PlsX [Candidatus Omnitrophota bacterium]
MSYRIGLDISGGDHAPGEIFKGAFLAKRESDADIVLIGSREEIALEAEKEKINLNDFTVVDAPEKIGMDEQAAMSIRKKKNSSIVVGVNLLKERKIDAFVSCGNTGAVVSAATLKVGLIEGVERPGIAILFPTKKGVSLLIDVGANINPKPLHLLQYGVMASLYYSLVFDTDSAAVGLLNIGEEETKGPDFMKSVHKLFTASSLNFIGNLEAKHIFAGRCECIVCDGFVGNIVLKVSEGLVEMIGKFLIDAVKKDILGRLGFLLMRNSLKRFKRVVDYAEYGGAPLLGVDGVVIIGHGRSSSYAVKNAVKVALQELKRDLIGSIKGKLDEECKQSRVDEILSA